MQRYKVGGVWHHPRYRYVGGVGDFDVFFGGYDNQGLLIKWSNEVGRLTAVHHYPGAYNGYDRGPQPTVSLDLINLRLANRGRGLMTEAVG